MQFMLLFSLLSLPILNDSAIQEKETRQDSDVFPKLIRTPWITSSADFVKPKIQQLSFTETLERSIHQKYAVQVPTSEGSPMRMEQRTRESKMVDTIANSYPVKQLVFTDCNSKAISAETAIARIQKHNAFLFVPKGKTVAESDRNLFNKELVLVSPVNK